MAVDQGIKERRPPEPPVVGVQSLAGTLGLDCPKPLCDRLTAPVLEQKRSDNNTVLLAENQESGHALAGVPQQQPHGSFLAGGYGVAVGGHEVGGVELSPLGVVTFDVMMPPEARGRGGDQAEMREARAAGAPYLRVRVAAEGRKNRKIITFWRAPGAVDPPLMMRDDKTTKVSSGSGTPSNHLKQQLKRYLNYCFKTLLLVVTIIAAYPSASCSITKKLLPIILAAQFIVDAVLFIMFIADAPWFIMMAVKWGTTLVSISWFLLVFLLFLLLISFHKDYAYAIILVPLLIVAALLHHKWQLGVRQRSTKTGETGDAGDIEAGRQGIGYTNEADDEDANTQHDEDNERWDHIFDLSSGIFTCGGFIAFVFGHHMVDKLNAVGYLFCFTMTLALHLSLATTVRTTILTRHATFLAVLPMVLLMATVITAVIYSANINAVVIITVP